jgi:hypothetical protein
MIAFDTRRSFLGLLGRTVTAGTITTAPVALAAPVVTALKPATGPIEPADYIAQRLALGDRLIAIVYLGKTNGFAEYSNCGDDHGPVRRRALAVRMWESGVDFHPRVAAILLERGMFEDVTPRKKAVRAVPETGARS